MIFNDKNFQKEVLEFNGLVLVDFFAEWCGPCKLMSPIIEELADEYKGKNIKIGKYNSDENNEMTEKYQILSLPTIYLFKNGKIADRVIGYTSKDDLIEMVNKNIN